MDGWRNGLFRAESVEGLVFLQAEIISLMNCTVDLQPCVLAVQEAHLTFQCEKGKVNNV